jgi:hypothetical protein
MIQVQPLEVNKFSGGIADDIYNNTPDRSEILDNFIVMSNETPQTRPGSIVDDVTVGNGRIPAGNQRIGALINYDNNANLLVQSAKKFYYRNPSAYTTIQGPTGNDVFTTGTVNNIPSYADWNKHIFLTHDGWPRPMKIYKDQAGVFQVRTSGLPALATIPVITVGTAGAESFLYAFHYFYEYQVGNQTFQTAGPVQIVEVLNSTAPNVSPNTISGIPVLANGVTDNYDTANIKVKIFRTTNGGIDQWFLGEVTNGTTTFNDNIADATITDGTLLYLNDGTLDNDPPPIAKFVHVVNNIGYYAFLKEGAEEFPFDYRASSPFSPDACPLDFRDTVEDVIKGFSSVQSIPIIFCNKYVYRVEGNFDQYGRGGMNHVRISDNAGLVSNLSVVRAEGQIFWAGNDGFYVSDGYKVSKISDGINDRYKALLQNTTNASRIYGVFDELNRRIHWALQTDSSSFDNDAFYTLELRYGVKPDSCFSTWSGGASFRPTALCMFKGDVNRADTRGYIMKHNELYTTDPLVDTLNFPENWNTQPIIHHYRSIAFNFGSTYMRKIATKILLTARNKTNVSIQITAINDDGKIKRSLKEIRWRRNFIWGDPDFIWGDANCVWNAEGLIEQWRRMPAKGLRFSYIQIDITNAYTAISNSDTIGKATSNPTANTITLDTAAISDWPLDCVGYFISTEVDGYVKQYEIITRTPDTLTVLDPQNTLPFGSLKWLMKGTKKSEILNFISYNIHWANLSKTQSTFEAGQDGGNSNA